MTKLDDNFDPRHGGGRLAALVSPSRRRFLAMLGASGVLAAVAPGRSAGAAIDDNLLPNPGFEEVTGSMPSSWAVYPGANGAIASSTATVHGGARSVFLDDPSSTTGNGLRSSHVVVTPGTLYRGSIYAYPAAGVAQMYLEFWDSAGARVGVQIATASETERWTQLTLQNFAPDEAATATVLLYLHGANVGSAYYDDAFLGAGSTEPARDFPLLVSGHPRLYFTADDLPVIAARTTDTRPTLIGPSPKDLWAQVLADAKTFLGQESFTQAYASGINITYPLPPVQPPPHEPPPGFSEYPYWTALARGIELRLDTLALAAVVTGERAYHDRAKEYLMSLAGWETWSEPTYGNGKANLDTASLMFTAAFTYDVLYADLSATERSAVEGALEKLGAQPIYRDWLSPADSNGVLACMSALGSVGAVLLGVSDNATVYLTHATDMFAWWLERRRTTGSQEGLLYTALSTDDILKASDHIFRTTGVRDLLDDPYFNETVGGDNEHAAHLVPWLIYSLVPGCASSAPISDSSASNYFFISASVLAGAGGDGHAGWYLANGRPSDSAFNEFIYGDPDTPVRAPADLPTSEALLPIGQAALRSGWAADDVALVFVSGKSNMGHNHYDQNSFIIGVANTWIASDPGYEDYVAGPGHDFTTAYGHSTIYVDGKAQNVKGAGQLTRGVISPAADFVAGDAAAAYRDPALTTFTRRIAFIPPHYYVIVDDIAADVAHRYDWQLYSGSGASYEVDGMGVDLGFSGAGQTIRVANASAQLVADFLAPAGRSVSVAEYPGAEGYGPYFTVSTTGTATTARFVAVLQAAPFSTPGLVLGKDAFNPAKSSGVEYKDVGIGGATLLFCKAVAPGGYGVFDIETPADGDYTGYVRFGQSTVYGQVQVGIDGVDAGPVFDGYSPAATLAPPLELGQIHLAQGAHEVKITLVGKNVASGGYDFAVDTIQFVPAGETPEPPTLSAAPAGLIDTATAVGARITRPDDPNGIIDLVLFGGPDGIDADDVATDGSEAAVSADSAGRIERYAAAGATILSYQGRTLLSATAAISAGVVYDDSAMKATGAIEVGAAATVRLFCRPSEIVVVDGETLDSAQYGYDDVTGLLRIEVGAGRHTVTVTGPDILSLALSQGRDSGAAHATFGVTSWERSRARFVVDNAGLTGLRLIVNGQAYDVSAQLKATADGRVLLAGPQRSLRAGANRVIAAPAGGIAGSAMLTVEVSE